MLTNLAGLALILLGFVLAVFTIDSLLYLRYRLKLSPSPLGWALVIFLIALAFGACLWGIDILGANTPGAV